MCERQHTVRNHRSKSQVNLQELFSGKTQLRQPFHGLFCYFTLQLVTLMMLIFQAVKCQQGKQAYILYTVNGFLFFMTQHASGITFFGHECSNFSFSACSIWNVLILSSIMIETNFVHCNHVMRVHDLNPIMVFNDVIGLIAVVSWRIYGLE